MDRVPRQEVRRGPAAGRDRHAGDLCEASRCACSSSTSRRTCRSSARRSSTRSAWSSRRPPRSTACAPTRNSIRERRSWCYGPINKQRWIYACSKQLMDRVICGLRHAGRPRLHAVPPVQLDRRRPRFDLHRRRKAARACITQFLGHIVRGEPIQLVDGGAQKRAFTYIDDGIDALMQIIENKDGVATRQDLQRRQPGQQLLGARAGRHDAGRSPPTIRNIARRAKQVQLVETTSARLLRQGLPGRAESRAEDREHDDGTGLEAAGH